MTIYDIAKEAGVSPSTVSRVINNKKGIKPETRERIEKLLIEKNFVLNETARGLSTQSSKTIGILLEDIRISHHTESIYVIEQEMTKNGYTCITFSTGSTKDGRVRCMEILQQRRVDGVILMGSMFETKEMKTLVSKYLSNIPVVIANGYIDLPNVYGVLVDEENGVKECMKLLCEKGYKKPAFVTTDETPSTQRKLKGFMSGVYEQWGDKQPVIFDICTEDTNPYVTLETGKEITKQLINKHSDIDCIVYSIDLLAVGGLLKLQEMGVNVPSQVGVIGIDNTLYGTICTPSLTTLDNHLTETSKNAARILLDAMENQENSHKIMLFTGIIERDSTQK